jgi:Fic family protein
MTALHFKQQRPTYYELLDCVRRDGDRESWLAFFLEGARVTAEGTVVTAQRLSTTFQNDRRRIESMGRRVGSGLRVHEAIKARPILSLTAIRERTGLSFPAASSAMDLLVRSRHCAGADGKAPESTLPVRPLDGEPRRGEGSDMR